MTDAASGTPDLPARETEAQGETVGEAKWSALRELERRFPGLDKTKVEYVVLSEGERGLLGVGFVPARVVARLGEAAHAAPAFAAETPATPGGSALRELLEQVRRGLGVDASVAVREEEGSLLGVFYGPDLGLLIGKRGQTIDAIQYLANAVVSRTMGERSDVVVDAAGYRGRRQASLEALADRTASRVAASGQPAMLEPMSATERKIVHLRLKDRDDVFTESEGAEPNRHVVVRPAE